MGLLLTPVESWRTEAPKSIQYSWSSLAEGSLEVAGNGLRPCPGPCYRPFPDPFHVFPVETALWKELWLVKQQSSLSVKYKPWQTSKCWFHVVRPSQTKECTTSTTVSMIILLLACLKKGDFSPISSLAWSRSQPEAEHPGLVGNSSSASEEPHKDCVWEPKAPGGPSRLTMPWTRACNI